MSDKIEGIFCKAVHCTACFDGKQPHATVDVAQPRPIGRRYWTTKPKIALVPVNPAAGRAEFQVEDENPQFARLLRVYRDTGTAEALEAVLQHQRDGMPRWFPWYFDPNNGLGLVQEEIAVANTAWCATPTNKYPLWMRSECMKRHTLPLLKILKPDVVLLSGGGAHEFAAKVKATCPEVWCVWHYADRRSNEARAKHAREVRKMLAELRGKSAAATCR